MAISTIHTGSRRFRRKICGGKTCTPPQTNTRRKLQIHNRVGRHKVHRNYTRLVLQTKKSAYITTRIHTKNPSNSSTTNKIKNKTNHTQPYLSYMGPKNNIPRNHHQRHCLKKRERHLFKKCAEKFCF